MPAPTLAKPPIDSSAPAAHDHDGWLLSLCAAWLLAMTLVMAFSIAPF